MTQAEAYDADGDEIGVSSGARPELLEGERERAARERLFDDVLASVELAGLAKVQRRLRPVACIKGND